VQITKKIVGSHITKIKNHIFPMRRINMTQKAQISVSIKCRVEIRACYNNVLQYLESKQCPTLQKHFYKQTNSMALSPQANYTD
jgi:hypothetical protein